MIWRIKKKINYALAKAIRLPILRATTKGALAQLVRAPES